MSFQILSLSGGGFLGLYTIALLSSLEKHFGAPIAGKFDLLAGTSIGGVIALALAAEVPAESIQAAFEENGPSVFGKDPPPRSWLLSTVSLKKRLFRSRYRADALRSTISAIVGADTRIGDLRHPVIIPAVNLSKGTPQLFKTPHHETFKLDLHLSVVDVAMATSAAPTFFPLAQINNSLFADGGLFANSPDMLALHEATHFFGQDEGNVAMLSVGTTTARFAFAHTSAPEFGIAQWFRNNRLWNVMLASQQHVATAMLLHKLQKRYIRLDRTQSKEQEQVLGLDVATDAATSTIKALADATFQRALNIPELTALLTRKAPAPRFFKEPALATSPGQLSARPLANEGSSPAS